MGQDDTFDNPYYTEALKYYRYHPSDQTSDVVTSCRSLQEMRDYLLREYAEQQRPWGVVNVVVHSNEWRGIGTPIQPNGQRTTTGALYQAIADSTFLPLPNHIMDAQTQIVLQSCALGRNAELLKAISVAFGGNEADGQRPIVRSSRQFIHYQSPLGKPHEIQRYLADFWYAFYATGYRPGDIKLTQQLEMRYPDIDLDWRDMLTRTAPRYPGDSYHYTFNVPLNWTVTYPDVSQRPKLRTKAEEMAWLQTQTELQEALRQYNIPAEHFRWRFDYTTHTFEDGVEEPAIVVRGKTTILCVLQPLVTPNPMDSTHLEPLVPAITDERYYAAEMPVVAEVRKLNEQISQTILNFAIVQL